MSGPVKDYVCLDLETSGLYPKYDKIIEIGAVKVKNGQITDRFRSLVNPGRKLTEITTAITGIHDGDLVDVYKRQVCMFCKKTSIRLKKNQIKV